MQKEPRTERSETKNGESGLTILAKSNQSEDHQLQSGHDYQYSTVLH